MPNLEDQVHRYANDLVSQVKPVGVAEVLNRPPLARHSAHRRWAAVAAVAAVAIAGAALALPFMSGHGADVEVKAVDRSEGMTSASSTSLDQATSSTFVQTTTSVAAGTDEWRDGDTKHSVESLEDALRAGRLPDLRGWDLNTLGDELGILYDIQRLIGIQKTVDVANEEVAAGLIYAQGPTPGTPLEEIDTWTLVISAGGPETSFSQLPSEVSEFAMTLRGFDPNEPILRVATPSGEAYKTDLWLFSLSCDAVRSAYRTFLDGSYETACPR